MPGLKWIPGVLALLAAPAAHAGRIEVALRVANPTTEVWLILPEEPAHPGVVLARHVLEPGSSKDFVFQIEHPGENLRSLTVGFRVEGGPEHQARRFGLPPMGVATCWTAP